MITMNIVMRKGVINEGSRENRNAPRLVSASANPPVEFRQSHLVVTITVTPSARSVLAVRISLPANAVEGQLLKPPQPPPPVLPGIVLGYPLQQLDRLLPDVLVFVEEAEGDVKESRVRFWCHAQEKTNLVV